METCCSLEELVPNVVCLNVVAILTCSASRIRAAPQIDVAIPLYKADLEVVQCVDVVM